ncbi:hypothetical protein GCM10022216_22740 [Sphingobacterium kyonggiense]|uniref:Uncharacterized protein n=1 Tax=Sphingobacterium kyonggiense TaxID=714075 RepID=A0ABP7YVN9_9SPHI
MNTLEASQPKSFFISQALRNVQLSNRAFLQVEITDKQQEVICKSLVEEYEVAIEIDEVKSPKHLFKILQNHQENIIVFNCDLLKKRREYMVVLEGAVCANPYTAENWKVSFDGESFDFNGRVVLFSPLSLQKLNKAEKLYFIMRDCYRI